MVVHARATTALALLAPWVANALCPNDCSRRGLCTGPGTEGYCFCEWGSTGDDCSVYMCPMGDDPLTEGQQPRAINITTSAASAKLAGSFKFSFQGESTELPADATLLDGAGCKAALEKLASVGRVECSRHDVTAADSGATYHVKIWEWPSAPHMNNIYYHDGNPALSDFSCEAGDTLSVKADAGVRCVVTDAATEEVFEYTPCSNHGVCNKKTGKCACHHGFKGAACAQNMDREDKLLGYADSPYFSGNVARLAAFREASPNFRFLNVEAGGSAVATLLGDGKLTLHEHGGGGLLVAAGGATVASGGLTVGSEGAAAGAKGAAALAGITVASGGVQVGAGDVHVRGGQAAAEAVMDVGLELNAAAAAAAAAAEGGAGGVLGGVSTTTVLKLSVSPGVEAALAAVDAAEGLVAAGQLPPVPDVTAAGADGVAGSAVDSSVGGLARILSAGVGEEERFSVALTGRSTVHKGGLEVQRGGARVRQGGLLVDRGGATVAGGGLSVAGAVAVGGDGVFVKGGGLEVRDGGAELGTSSAVKDALTVHASNAEYGAAVLQLHAAAAAPPAEDEDGKAAGGEDGFKLISADAGGEPRFQVLGTGRAVVHGGGVHVKAGGVRVGAGGATVETGGLSVGGGLRVTSGGLTLEGAGGFNISDGGLRVASSADAAPALTVAAQGASFAAAALRVDAPAVGAGAAAGGGGFKLLEARAHAAAEDGGMRPVFSVDGAGAVRAEGGIIAGAIGGGGAGGVRSEGDLVAESRAVLRASTVAAGDAILVPSSGSHVTVTDDLAEAANVVTLQREGAVAGQLLLLHNADVQPTAGVVVPPGKAVLFVFAAGGGSDGGGEWRSLSVTELDASALDGVTSLKAADDLDIGAHALTAARLVVSGQREGRLALLGAGGELEGRAGLEFAVERQGEGDDATESVTLRADKIGAFVAAGDIDMADHQLKNVVINGGTIMKIRELEVESLKIMSGMSKSNLAVSSQTKGQLTYYGESGALTGDDGLVFTDGTLLAPSLGGFVARGDIDMRRNASAEAEGVAALGAARRVLGAELVNGTVRGAALVETSRFALRGAARGAIAVFGEDGELVAAGAAAEVEVGADGEAAVPGGAPLRFHDGVLGVPGLAAARLAADIDGAGHAIANVQLRNGSAAGLASLETAALSISTQAAGGAGRVLVFGEGGAVRGTDALTFAEDTLVVPKLIFVEAAGDADFKGHEIKRAVLGEGSLVKGAKSVSAQQLVLGGAVAQPGTADDVAGRLATVGADGALAASSPALRFVEAPSAADAAGQGGTLHVPSIGAFTAAGDINMADKKLMHVQITKGAIEGISGLQAYDVDLVEGVLRDVEVHALSLNVKGGSEGALAAFGEEGKLRPAKGVALDKEGTLTVAKMGAFALAGDVDCATHVLKDAKIRGAKTTLVGAAALSARRIAVTQQKAGRVAVFGEGGEVGGSSALTFAGGVLRAKKLGAFEADGDADFKGKQLKNAAITGGTIKGVTLAVASQKPGGVALYGAEGALTGDPALTFKDGVLAANKIAGFAAAGAVDMGKHQLKNAAIVDATIEGVKSLRVGALTIDGESSGTVALFGPKGALRSDKGLTFAGGTLKAAKIGAFTAAGAIDFASQKMSNVAIAGGTISGVSKLRVKKLGIEDQEMGQAAVFGANGVLGGSAALSVVGGVLVAPKIGAFQAQGPIDFNGKRMSNVAVVSGSVEGVSVKAEAIAVTTQKAGQLAMYGAGGALSGDSGLTFSAGVLTAAQLGAFKATGPVDFNAQPVTNLKVTSGEIAGASLLSAVTLKASGALEVGGDGSVGGDLVVSGSVSGSGSYHDISDGRFKHRVRALANATAGAPSALATLRALRGVSFEFHGDRAEGLPRGVPAFPRGTQFGFIAQEVERVLPEIVRTVDAAEGSPEYKTVAYSQVVPWLVEGVKQQDATIGALEQSVRAAEDRAVALEAQLAAEQQRAAASEAKLAKRLADVEAKLTMVLDRL